MPESEHSPDSGLPGLEHSSERLDFEPAAAAVGSQMLDVEHEPEPNPGPVPDPKPDSQLLKAPHPSHNALLGGSAQHSISNKVSQKMAKQLF